MKKWLLFFSMVIGCFQISAQQSDRSGFLCDSLDNYVNKALEKWKIPGIAVGIIKDGQTVLLKGYGVKQAGLPGKVDGNTLFMIGSQTCAFTSTALAMLEVEHKLSLDSPVSRYLPDFKLATPLLTQQVTLRDLLSHRVGFISSEGEFSYWSGNLTRKEVLTKLSHLMPAYGFRTHWGFTDADYVAAAEVIPQITGKSCEQYINESILIPLGMTRTFITDSAAVKVTNKAKAHLLNDGVLTTVDEPALDNIAPAEGMRSSVLDISQWVKALLAGGKLGNRQVIPSIAIRNTMTPQMYQSTYRRTTGEMCINLDAIGWFYQNLGDKILILHDDVGSGFTSIINLVPQENLGIIVLTNSQTNFFHEALALEILDVYIKRPYQDYSSRFASDMRSQNEEESEYKIDEQINARLRDTVALHVKPALYLKDYTGSYHNDLYGDVTITSDKSNGLIMYFEYHPHLSAKLYPLGGNRFYSVYSNPLFGKFVFPFEIKDGKVIGVSVSSAVESASYLFKKR